LYGISEISGDFRDIEMAIKAGNKRANTALKTFAYYVKRYIGEYLAALNGADCIVFTAGAGENNPSLRSEILNNMDQLGIVIDESKNNSNIKEGLISTESSKVKVAIIPTNEEYIVASEVQKYITNKNNLDGNAGR
jgi:acetate kinase